MVMLSWLNGDFFFYLAAIALGYAGSTLQNWSLHRRLYSLECSVSDVEAKLLIEIKRRAGHERQNSSKIEGEILAAAKAQPKQPELPWWQRVNQG